MLPLGLQLCTGAIQIALDFRAQEANLVLGLETIIKKGVAVDLCSVKAKCRAFFHTQLRTAAIQIASNFRAHEANLVERVAPFDREVTACADSVSRNASFKGGFNEAYAPGFCVLEIDFSFEPASLKVQGHVYAAILQIEIARNCEAIDAQPLGVDMGRCLRVDGEPANKLRTHYWTRGILSRVGQFFGVGRVMQHLELGWGQVWIKAGFCQFDELLFANFVDQGHWDVHLFDGGFAS